jgi:transposase
MSAMVKHRSHSIEFKRQIAQEFMAGETLHALAKRHDISRNLIRIWVKKLETGAFDEDAQAGRSSSGKRGEDRGTRTHGWQAGTRNRVSKGGAEKAPRPKSAITSVFTGPTASGPLFVIYPVRRIKTYIRAMI